MQLLLGPSIRVRCNFHISQLLQYNLCGNQECHIGDISVKISLLSLDQHSITTTASCGPSYTAKLNSQSCNGLMKVVLVETLHHLTACLFFTEQPLTTSQKRIPLAFNQ